MELFTAKMIAEKYHITNERVRQLRELGAVPYVRVGGRYLYTTDQIDLELGKIAPDGYESIPDAAIRLNRSVPSVRELAKNGRLESVRIGRRTWIKCGAVTEPRGHTCDFVRKAVIIEFIREKGLLDELREYAIAKHQRV